jgi:HEAT repeat protein
MRSLFIVLLGLGLVLSGAAPASAADKVYKGKSLKDWIAMLKNVNDKKSQAYASVVLGEIGKDAVPALIQVLKEDDPARRNLPLSDQVVKKWALLSLIKIGKPAAAPLVEALRSKDQAVLSMTSLALKQIGAPSIPPLIAALNDPERPFVNEVAGALAAIGEPAVTPLTKVLKDGTPKARVTALQVLGPMKSRAKAAVPAIIALLKDDDREVRFAAGYFLKMIDPEAARKAGVR